MSSEQQLTQEEYDIIIDDARFGDLETLQEIFAEIPASKLLDITNEDTKNTPLHVSAANGHIETVKFLLELLTPEQANQWVNSQNYQGNTALHWASLNGHVDVVKYICDNYNADVFLRNNFQHDAIFEAEKNGRDEVEQYFLEKFNVEDDAKDEGVEGEGKDVTYSNNDKEYYDNIEIKPGKEIDEITKETIDTLETNEEFLKKKINDLQISSKTE